MADSDRALSIVNEHMRPAGDIVMGAVQMLDALLLTAKVQGWVELFSSLADSQIIDSKYSDDPRTPVNASLIVNALGALKLLADQAHASDDALLKLFGPLAVNPIIRR